MQFTLCSLLYIIYLFFIRNIIFGNRCLANPWTLSETMVLKIYKFCHSCIALSFYATVLECGTPLHFKMPRNRKRECPACFKQVRSDVLKTHCRIKHGMSDDQNDAMKSYS